MNNLNYILLLITNLPYYFYILYNRYFIIIAIISTLHHSTPFLTYRNENFRLSLLKLDIFMSLNIFIYILLTNYIYNLLKYLYVPLLFLLAEYNIRKKNYNYYTLYHCIWHITSANAIFNLI